MGTVLFSVSLTAAIALSTICAATANPSHGVDLKTDKDDVYLQLLGRVENLEKREQEQQIEINQLRAELITEKQRTSKLEGRLSRILVNFADRHGNDGVKSTSVGANTQEGDDVYNTQQDQHPTGDRKSVQDTRSVKTEDHESRIRRHVDMPVIAFHATLTSDSLHTGAHQSIVFDRVVTNIGSAYNPHGGSFIAPIAGVYVFHTTVMVNNHHVTHMSINKNAVSVANLYVRGIESGWGNDGAMTVLHLNKGDDVMVRNHDADKDINGDHYSMFSGFLLYKDNADETPILG